jgi:hypothetical protein
MSRTSVWAERLRPLVRRITDGEPLRQAIGPPRSIAARLNGRDFTLVVIKAL